MSKHHSRYDSIYEVDCIAINDDGTLSHGRTLIDASGDTPAYNGTPLRFERELDTLRGWGAHDGGTRIAVHGARITASCFIGEEVFAELMESMHDHHPAIASTIEAQINAPRTISALLINPETKTVSVIDTLNQLEGDNGIYTHLGCTFVEHVGLRIGNKGGYLLVDGEPFDKPAQPGFDIPAHVNGPTFGRGVIVGIAGDQIANTPFTAEEINSLITRWLDAPAMKKARPDAPETPDVTFTSDSPAKAAKNGKKL